MRSILRRLPALLFPLFLVACGDLPTSSPAPDLAGAGPILSGECSLQGDGTFLCPPAAPDWGDWCDPYHFDCGGGDCMESAPGTGGIDGTTVQGCTGWGGDPTAGGIGDYGGGGGGTSSGGSQDDPGSGPYAEGPFLWAACVLAVVGGTYSVEIVGDKFVAWYEAHKALVRARRALDYAVDMQRDGYYIDPDDLDMAYYRLDFATENRDDAVAAAEEATGVSILTLLAAGFACGAAAAAPTP